MIEVGSASQPAPDCVRCGDAYVSCARDGGSLIAVVDALGHGDEAADAADAAVEALRLHAGLPLSALVTRVHEDLRRTRGVVLSVVVVDDPGETLEWLGVGNVEAVVVGAGAARRSLIVRGGVVGYKLPPLRPQSVAFGVDDTLLMFTDGVSARVVQAELSLAEPAAQLADELLQRARRGDDDALVLIARRDDRRSTR